MRLSQLIAAVPSAVHVRGDAETEITAVVEDSRQVGPGALFVARPGTRVDGGAFLDEAARRGAAALLVAPGAPAPAGPAVVHADDVAAAGARLAERMHRDPSRALGLVGVTGTNGKTTTTWLVREILRAAGRRCGLAGTVVIDDGIAAAPATLTTPDAPSLSALLARMAANGCAAAAIECSSHALVQRRTAGLRFAAAVFTNLSGDHLDYHGSMEAYADAKALLFEGLDADASAIVNIDDPAAVRMLRGCRAAVIACSARDSDATYFASPTQLGRGFVAAQLRAPWGDAALRLPLVGAHNLMNALQAAAAAHALGVEPAAILAGLEGASAPPGRLEPVTGPDEPFSVLVDYAHTDDALANVLEALRPLVGPGGRLRVVFGCGGDRDRTKRPRMAAVACRIADDVVITSDNPRTEPPESIIEEILAGVPSDRRCRVRTDPDRAAAIRLAVDDAAPGDIVVIAGKGHETYQIVGDAKRPFDDRIEAREALRRRETRRAAAFASASASAVRLGGAPA